MPQNIKEKKKGYWKKKDDVECSLALCATKKKKIYDIWIVDALNT